MHCYWITDSCCIEVGKENNELSHTSTSMSTSFFLALIDEKVCILCWENLFFMLFLAVFSKQMIALYVD